MAERLRITKTDESQMKKRYWDKFYHSQKQRVGPLVVGSEVVWGVLRLTPGKDESNLDAIEQAIANIPGVENCELVVSGQVPLTDDVSVDCKVYAIVEGRFVLQNEALVTPV